MNRSLVLRRLWWKEFQQLWPLVGLLLLMGLILQVLALMLPLGTQPAWRQAAALLGMPGLFAAGAGALLVGQEKELRTLDWLRSLPLAAGDLVRTKLLVGLLGLVFVWAFSFSIGSATNSLGVIFDRSGGEFLWPLHTLFLLMLGFASAWYFQSSLVSLLVVLPLACLPLLLATLNQWLIKWSGSFFQVEPEPWLMATYLCGFSLAAFWMSLRFSKQYLAPRNPPVQRTETNAQASARSRGFSYAPSSPTPALLWQFAAQNRDALVGLSSLIWVGTLAFFWCAINYQESLLGVLALAIFLAISWLGLLAFQGDVLQHRITFLADRGVSPSLTWLTRQAIPWVILSVAWLICVLLGIAIRHRPDMDIGSVGFGLIAVLGFGTYFVSQWLGQLVRSPILGAIVAPFVAAGVVAYLSFAIMELGATLWSVGLALALAPLATLWMTRLWMDNRTGLRFWCCHGGLICVALLIPLSDYLIYHLSNSSISADAQREISEILAQQSTSAQLRVERLPLPLGDASGEPPQFSSRTEHRSQYYAAIRRQMAENPRGVSSRQVLDTCVSDMLITRMRDLAGDGDATAHYRETVQVLVDSQQRLRRDPSLSEQDNADVIEILLLEELKAPQAKSQLGDKLYRQLIAVLSDKAGRRDARRQAIAESYSFYQINANTLGGYSMMASPYQRVTTRAVWDAKRNAGLICELALQMVDASGSQLTELRNRMYQLIGVAEFANQHLAFLMDADGEPQLLYSELNSRRLLGLHWNGPWEQEAIELAAQLSSTLESKVQE